MKGKAQKKGPRSTYRTLRKAVHSTYHCVFRLSLCIAIRRGFTFWSMEGGCVPCKYAASAWQGDGWPDVGPPHSGPSLAKRETPHSPRHGSHTRHAAVTHARHASPDRAHDRRRAHRHFTSRAPRERGHYFSSGETVTTQLDSALRTQHAHSAAFHTSISPPYLDLGWVVSQTVRLDTGIHSTRATDTPLRCLRMRSRHQTTTHTHTAHIVPQLPPPPYPTRVPPAWRP